MNGTGTADKLLFNMESNTTVLPLATATDAGCVNLSTSGNSTLLPCVSNDDNNDKEHLQNILTILVSAVLAVIMIGIGCAVEFRKLARHFKNPTGILTGLVCQFVIMPVLAYTWARIFEMDDPETLSLLIVGSCPGGTMSNIIAYWVGGDMELSAVMTTVSVTASLGMLPLLLFIYSRLFGRSAIVVPFSTIGITMALIIFPLGIGTFLRYKFPRAAGKILKICGIGGFVALFVVAGLAVYLFHEFWSFQVGQIITAILYPLCGMILGYTISSIVSVIAKPLRLTHKQRRTVSIETGIQNQQVALSIIQLAGWPISITGRMVVFPMMYAFSQIGWSIIYIALYHIVSYARIGKFPHLEQRVDEVEDNEKQSVDPSSIVADNPAFDAKE